MIEQGLHRRRRGRAAHDRRLRQLFRCDHRGPDGPPEPFVTRGTELLNQRISRRSQIIAYNNDFHMMAFIVVPLLLIVPMSRAVAGGPCG
jgi:hypothetical protein